MQHTKIAADEEEKNLPGSKTEYFVELASSQEDDQQTDESDNEEHVSTNEREEHGPGEEREVLVSADPVIVLQELEGRLFDRSSGSSGSLTRSLGGCGCLELGLVGGRGSEPTGRDGLDWGAAGVRGLFYQLYSLLH